jgi:hypothetical protein
MATEISQASFDYTEFDKESKSKLICCAGQVARHKGAMIKNALALGEAITAAHEVLATAGKEGRFGEWVDAECDFGRRSAYNYMNAWERFGNCATVAQFNDGAMYALAEPKAPPEAAKEAEKLATKGIRITLDKAKELLAKFKPKPPKAAPEDNPADDVQEPEPEPTTPENDTVGQPIPKQLSEVFDRANEFEQHARALTSIGQWAEKIGGELPGKWLHVQSFKADLSNAKRALRHNKPYAVCPYCQAKKSKCEACKGHGFVSKRIYDSAPQELRI